MKEKIKIVVVTVVLLFIFIGIFFIGKMKIAKKLKKKI